MTSLAPPITDAAINKALAFGLSMLATMGAFVEVGVLTFSIGAGSKFGYSLIWVIVIGAVGLIVYGEIAGRIAVVRGEPLFALIRSRDGLRSSLLTLLTFNSVSVLVCAAEIGGVALVWQLLSGWPYRWLILLALLSLILVVWFTPMKWIQRAFGLLALMMIVFVVAAAYLHPRWSQAAASALPNLPEFKSGRDGVLYAYSAVALLGSILMPYKTYFRASVAIDDKTNAFGIASNRLLVVIGFALGALLSVSLLMIGADFFAPRQIDPSLPGDAALATASLFGITGMLLAVGGMLFAFAGAAIANALSGAYNLAQLLGWRWGKGRRPRSAARFVSSWIALLCAAALIVLTGVDPVRVIEYSVILSVLILPFAYFPLLVIGADRRIMGDHASGKLVNALGGFYFLLVTLAALAALPLFILTHGGQR